MIKKAIFSPCRKYRYALWRTWDESKDRCMFICLNPSTADETKDDPTIRRCINFAKSWGYGSMVMTNVFAFRATKPKDMLRANDPVGPDNRKWLHECALKSKIVIHAWGSYGYLLGNDIHHPVYCLNRRTYYLKKTKAGHPCHPLYLKKTLLPIPIHSEA